LTAPFINRQRIYLLAVLVTLLASIYMLTYSGRIESGDSLTLFDATSSLIQFHDTYLDISAWFNPPRAFNQIGQFYPLQSADIEPLSIFLTAPLYWLAYRLPGIGLVHTVWLFNIVVTAAAGGVFFLYALALDYDERTGVVGALIFGIATIVWPYSKSLFREPLLLLTLLVAGLFIERWRTAHYRSGRLLVGILLAVVAALLTKVSAVFALPALLVIGIPAGYFRDGRWRRIESAILTLISVLILVVAFVNLRRLFFDVFSRLTQDTRYAIFYMQISIHSYFFSVGGSFWGTSPVVLLALSGVRKLWRETHHRYLWVGLLMVLAFAVGHATLRQEHWFGGLSWPPRFLVPVIPFLMLVALPIIDRVIHRPVPRRLAIGTVLLVAYSLWINFTGLSLWWGDYAGALPPQSGQIIEWSGGLNQFQYLRWVVIPGLWSSQPFDIAWVRVGTAAWLVIFALLAILSAGTLIWLLRHENPSQRSRSFVAALPVVFVLASWLGLRIIYVDEMYSGSNSSLHGILPVIEVETHPGDTVILTSNRYERFFSNYAKFSTARIVTLPPQPGEQSSPEQTAQIISDNPDALLTNLTIPFLHGLTFTRDRLWILADSGPFIPWSVRPVERFMAAHYYLIREITTDPPDPALRLIEYSTVDAPDPFGFRGPDYLTDLVYRNAILLTGYSLPSGTIYRPGEALPLSLYWEVAEPIDQDLTVAWFLADMNDSVIAQGMDSFPGGGFEHTSQWQVGVPRLDNRAMWLPEDLQPGSYQLWVKLYTYDNGAIQDLMAEGDTVVNETIGVLPTIIEIVP
jgi:hypothetical protein